ncbi:MAG: hypothetical protein BroJett039_06650 [Chloroflexota bacterium]|nr:MAG: hypothetical protein BroJett039_06650 [Chloroflexota bacterium]
MLTCPTCNFQNRQSAAFCSNCGSALGKPSTLFCSRCGAQNVAGSRFCSSCGNPLTGSLPPASSLTGLLPSNALLQSRYLILRKLGQGGMGAVYQANDTRLAGKLWAIKEMSDASLADPNERANAVAAFQREAQLLANLDHANLPKVSDFFQEQGKHYLVMDFVQGQTLEAVVEATTGFLNETTVMEWMEQLCDVLDYLHTRQPPIIFRDLKPANIMLTPENKIKLIDFGIARLFRPGKSKDTAQYGTIGFASPEQFGTGQTDARSDIYSLGVLLHHLLTRYDPSLSPFNLPPARNINPNVSLHIADIIMHATKAAPIERFQVTKELRQALQSKIAATLSTPSPLPITSTPKTQAMSYTLASGEVANTVEELVRLCEQDWERAMQQFYDGYFAKWLESIGEFGLASEAKNFSSQFYPDSVDKQISLQKWIDGTNVQQSRPMLAIQPARLEITLNDVNPPNSSKFPLGTLELVNHGQKLLVVQLEPLMPWLLFEPTRLAISSKSRAEIGVYGNLTQMPGNPVVVHPGIVSNGGNFTLMIQVNKKFPELDVSPSPLVFDQIGVISSLSGIAVGPKEVILASKDRGVLDSLEIRTNEKWILYSLASQTTNKAILLVWIDPWKLPNGLDITGQIIIESTAGTKIVSVAVTKR